MEAISTSSAPAPLYLNLHLQVNLEVGQQGEEDGQRELKHLGHGGDAVFGQCHAQVLLDGVDEHLVGAEHGPGALQHREQQLQRDDLGAQLVGSAGEKSGGSIRPESSHIILKQLQSESFSTAHDMTGPIRGL